MFCRLLACELLKFWMPVDDSTETDLWADEPASSQFFSRVCRIFDVLAAPVKLFVITQLILFGIAVVDRLLARPPLPPPFLSGTDWTVEKAFEEDFCWPPLFECWRWLLDYLRPNTYDIYLAKEPPLLIAWSQKGYCYLDNKAAACWRAWFDKELPTPAPLSEFWL